MRRLLIALSLCALPLAAQTSTLQGTVTDEQGAIIPSAVVTAVNTETATQRQSLANETGSYSFFSMQPGTYKIEAQLTGFRTFTTQIRLQVNVPSTLDIKLEVGSVVETVNVTAETPSINTQNASIGNAFTETQIRQLPIQTRNIVDLLSLQPTVTPTGQVAGARRDQNNVVLDGVDVNDNQSRITATSANQGFSSALPVPLDSVQEFRTTVAGQGADQGRSSGGQVTLVTKSGSNEYHGSLYEFHRNKATAANNWFSNRVGLPRENLVRNQYGASLGGRIVRDRAFFFVNWEDRKDRTATATVRQVPTESYKAGNIQLRLTDGRTVALTPQEVAQIDPKGIGASPYVLDRMKSFPVGNDALAGTDRGLNFTAFRFNAPKKLDNRAYVAKMDFNLDKAARHTLMLRGTLADNIEDEVLAQFPGQEAASKAANTSKGLAARYTAVISPSVVNVVSYGFTRLADIQSGIAGSIITSSLANLTGNTREVSRFIPTTNIVDDLTWNKGKHTVQTGINFRYIRNDRNTFANSYPTYGYSRNTMKGLGADITDATTAFLRQKLGDPTLRLLENTQVQNAFGSLLSIVNSYGGTYQYLADGSVLPFGQPSLRSFATNEYEFYVQDTFKIRSDLTLTYGLRYSNAQVPYERNGVQVATTAPLGQYFADRIYASENGIPGSAVPTAQIVYNLGGPVNDGEGWYKRDNNNFGPRLSLAYAPVSDSLLGSIFGKGSVFRAGGAVLYDRYGSNMVVTFSQSGSPGLSSTVSQLSNTDFTDSFRYNGVDLPAIPPPAPGGFPFTPPTIAGGFTSFSGVNQDLVAPYSYLLNASYARPLPGGVSVEVGYVGRLTRKGLVVQDYGQPLTNFKDNKSGMNWTEASGILRSRMESGLTPAMVRANPSLMEPVPFFENIFPGAANKTFTGSATANYFNTVYQTYGGSDLDALHDMDRVRQPNGQCISVTGCNTFFALQNAGYTAFVNASNASYHGGVLTIRRPVSRGWGFDFNYTLSHALDITSTSEAQSGTIQNSFDPRAGYASSDFDIRHLITANTVLELPFGKGQKFLSNAPSWVNQFVGGWQFSMLGRFRTGTPLTLNNGGVYPTNYLSSAIAVVRPGQTIPETGVFTNNNGLPSLFANTTAVNSFMGQYPGTVGTRNMLRRPSVTNFDISLGKYFMLPIEGHRIQLRGEGFNAFNNVNFEDPGTSLQNPSLLGVFEKAADARVMQFALRYEF